MVAFADLYQTPTLADAKASVIAIARAAGLSSTSWILGDPSERWIEIAARVIDTWGSVPAQAVRGFFLDLATDPGDLGDTSANQTPRAGWLSALGEGWYGTTRRGQTFATGTLTLTNAGSSPVTFYPLTLTFERATAGPDGGAVTYRNTADPSVYTDINGGRTLAPAASVDIPIQAEQIGNYGNATATTINIVVTAGLGTFTCSNAGALAGSEREGADDYRARCRIAAARLSYGGPAVAYRVAMNTTQSGTPLPRHDGSGDVGITRAYVSFESATGNVVAYFADPDGAADAVDVASANANIEGIVLGSITAPIGCVADCAAYTGAAATNTTVNVVATARIKARSGVSNAALKAAAEAAASPAITAAFATKDVGGDDQTAGAGVIYTTDIRQMIGACYAGLYDVIVTTPGGPSTAITLGHVAKVGTVALTVTVV